MTLKFEPTEPAFSGYGSDGTILMVGEHSLALRVVVLYEMRILYGSCLKTNNKGTRNHVDVSAQ